MSDWIEIQQNGALDPAKDSDGDGEADVWDEDNDGDGVSDRVDISPFASTEIKDYHRCRYYVNKHDLLVDIQVQPEDTGLIKWNGQTWNWPHDELGNMQDADDSSDDLELKPCWNECL